MRIYSRGLNDVTHFAPALARAVAALPACRLILDGEAIAYRAISGHGATVRHRTTPAIAAPRGSRSSASTGSIAFNDVQLSSRYPGGVALRLARLVRYRDDKTAALANTIDTVRAIAAGAVEA